VVGEGDLPKYRWRRPFIGRVATTVPLAASMIRRSHEHQSVTSTYLPSGVTATYFGTSPTWTTWSTARVLVSTR